MRLFDCLCGLFRPGSGRRRVHANHQAAAARVAELELQLAPLADLTEVRCALGADHPVWWTAETPGDCPWCLALTFAEEAKELRFLLGAGAGTVGGIDMAAAADTDGCCFTQPDPAQVPDFRISADIAPGPVGGEAADVNAETRATDVRALRASMDAGPVQVSWGVGGLSTRPPLPDEAPTERLSTVTAVLPIWDRSTPVVLAKPVELSPITAARAQESVLAAVGAAP